MHLEELLVIHTTKLLDRLLLLGVSPLSRPRPGNLFLAGGTGWADDLGGKVGGGTTSPVAAVEDTGGPGAGLFLVLPSLGTFLLPESPGILPPVEDVLRPESVRTLPFPLPLPLLALVLPSDLVEVIAMAAWWEYWFGCRCNELSPLPGLRTPGLGGGWDWSSIIMVASTSPPLSMSPPSLPGSLPEAASPMSSSSLPALCSSSSSSTSSSELPRSTVVQVAVAPSMVVNSDPGLTP